jgi:hypothetical protein
LNLVTRIIAANPNFASFYRQTKIGGKRKTLAAIGIDFNRILLSA